MRPGSPSSATIALAVAQLDLDAGQRRPTEPRTGASRPAPRALTVTTGAASVSP